MSNDATTSTEKATVELVADISVTTLFDENLTSALKRVLPSGFVTTSGKVRDAVGNSMRESRGLTEEPSDSAVPASDGGYDGMGVAVYTE